MSSLGMDFTLSIKERKPSRVFLNIKLEKTIFPLSETREAMWLSLAISMPKKNIRSHPLRRNRGTVGTAKFYQAHSC